MTRQGTIDTQETINVHELAKDIKKARKVTQLSVVNFAKEVGVNPNTLLKYEHADIKNPKESVAEKIIKYVNKVLEKESKPVNTKKSTIPTLSHAMEGKEVQTQKVAVKIRYWVEAEAILDVKSKIVGLNPLRTENVFSNPQQVRQLRSGLSEGEYEITRIKHEHIDKELVPNYVR